MQEVEIQNQELGQKFIHDFKIDEVGRVYLYGPEEQIRKIRIELHSLKLGSLLVIEEPPIDQNHIGSFSFFAGETHCCSSAWCRKF